MAGRTGHDRPSGVAGATRGESEVGQHGRPGGVIVQDDQRADRSVSEVQPGAIRSRRGPYEQMIRCSKTLGE